LEPAASSPKEEDVIACSPFEGKRRKVRCLLLRRERTAHPEKKKIARSLPQKRELLLHRKKRVWTSPGDETISGKRRNSKPKNLAGTREGEKKKPLPLFRKKEERRVPLPYCTGGKLRGSSRFRFKEKRSLPLLNRAKKEKREKTSPSPSDLEKKATTSPTRERKPTRGTIHHPRGTPD